MASFPQREGDKACVRPAPIGTGHALLRQWALFLGLLLPAAELQVARFFPSLHDMTVVWVVHELFLSWYCWVALAACFTLLFFQQVQASVLLWIPLLMLGCLCGVLLLYDGWYFNPGATAVAVALVLWRLLWAGWAHWRLVAFGLCFITLLEVACMLFHGGRFDDRFTAGVPTLQYSIFYFAVIGAGFVGLAFFWGYVTLRLEKRTRDLLAYLITRDLRCRQWFDAVKAITRCAEVPHVLTQPTALACCAPDGSPRPPGQARQGLLASVERVAREWGSFLFREVEADAASVFPDVREVPRDVKRGVDLALAVLARHAVLRGFLRRLRPVAGGFAMPSKLFRAMLWEGAWREYQRYWEQVMSEVAVTDTPTAEKAEAVAEWHFGRMVRLYEAWLEAEYSFFLSPQPRPEVSQAEQRIADLTRRCEKALRSAEWRRAPLPSYDPEEMQRQKQQTACETALTILYTKYLDLWLENIDRLVICKGLTHDAIPFEAVKHLRAPVLIAQVVCNLLACREGLRRCGRVQMESSHGLMADLALWCLVRQLTCDASASDGVRNVADGETRAVFNRYFEELGAVIEGRSLGNDGVAKRVSATVTEEIAVVASAYALWQATCGNWKTAFRPIYLLGQLNTGVQQLLNGVEPQENTASFNAVLRVAGHIRFVQAIQSLSEQLAEGRGRKGQKDMDFAVRRAVELALGLAPQAQQWCSSDFMTWYPDRSRPAAAFLSRRVARLIGAERQT